MSRLHKLLFAALALSLALIFQNCAGGVTTIDAFGTSNAALKESGNGGGYGGKLTTYVRKSDDRLCPDGSDVESVIEVEGQTARLLRQDCQEVRAVALPFAAINLMAHNVRNLIYGNGLYDLATKTDGRTTLLCRGEETDAVTGGREVVDATIRRQVVGGTVKYFGRVILGIYDAGGNLVKTYDMGEVPVAQVPIPPGQYVEFYQSLTLKDHQEVFALRFDPQTGTGGLKYADNIPADGPQPGHEPDRFRVQNLTCYR